ncbi:uncharacterized protein LOC134260895, partial [Saccostrea cucullata]|uniref:uncharacterized protein LOC134260895 n=1 Tax=Saccostrea cuccullata TaxID=36930 RepID=UPI002ECFBA4A
MASTEEETEVKETIETDISDLTVKTESIIDRSKKEKKSQGPSRIVVILKWLTTLTFAAVLLSCLVTSKITVIGLAQHLTESSTSKYQAFTMCLIILLAPNVISFSRSLWNIIGRSDIPWPNKKSIFLVIISAALESAGLSIVIFKALNTGQAASGVTAMEIGIFIPIFYFIKKNNRGMKFFRGLSVIAVLFAIAGASLDILLHIKYAVNTWSLCGYVLIYLSWFPYLNKHIFPPVMTTVRGPLNANGQTSRISINRPNSSASLPGVSSCSNLPSYNSTANTSGISSHLCDKTSPWKVLFISAFSKIVFILSSSALLIKFAMDDLSFDDGWTKGWTWSTSDDVFVLFIVHTTISIVGYAIAVFACHTCMDRGSFVIPLILSSPVAYIILAVPRSCEWIQNFSGNSQAFCVKDGSLIYSLVAMMCFFITISLTFGRLLWDIQNIVLQKEIQ